jgi:predicted NAD/FAD-binding protein
VFNWLAGLPILFAGREVSALVGIVGEPGSLLFAQIAGLAIVGFGCGYWQAACAPDENLSFVRLGMALKLGVVAIAFGNWFTGTINAILPVAALGDLVYALLFWRFLKRFRAQPKTIKEKVMAENIAIIGGGMAGLTAGYLLHDRHNVTLFEKENRLGGNAYTLDTKTGEDIDISVFFWSLRAYPNFATLLKKLGIRLGTWPMEGLSQSFLNMGTRRNYYLSCDPTKLRSTFSLKNFKSSIHQMVVLRNYLKMVRMYREGQLDGLTLRQALEFCPELTGDLLKLAIFPICIMTSMLWDELMDAPSEFAIAKIEKQIGSPLKFASWRLFPCKTCVYLEKLAAPFKDRIITQAAIASVARNGRGVTLTMADHSEHTFDKVIFACPADTALGLLAEPTGDEIGLLSPWRYKDGLVIVHTDKTNYPPENLWAMYSYLYTDEDGKINTSINAHYRFQNGVHNKSEYIGCQHPNIHIDPDKIEFKKVFRTPLYDKKSILTIKDLPSLNGKNNTYYCGSHFGYGLHEDAVTSAIDVGRMLGATWP